MSARIASRWPRWRPGPKATQALLALALAMVVAIGWMHGTGRASRAELAAPLTYHGDGLGVLAHIKAYADGEIVPGLPKTVESLGAPFAASWTDYPAEDFLYAGAALFARAFGLFPGTTKFVLVLSMLAGLAFFAVAVALGYRRSIAFAAAVLFALAPYAFVRSLGHLTLTAYWHVPLLLFAIAWAAASRPIPLGPQAQRIAALGAAVAAGLLNPYYLAGFGWLLACLLGGALLARNRVVAWRSAALLGTAVVAFVAQSLDSIWMNLAHGPNMHALHRTLAGLDLYGLRLPDLAFPYVHRSALLQAWSDAYQASAPGGPGRGEARTAYIGLVGCVSLAALLVVGTLQLAGRRFAQVSDWYWCAVGTIAFAVVGGINYALGSLGFVLLRGTNRFSIVLLCIALLWLCEVLSRRVRGIAAPVCAAAILAFGWWDQVPQANLNLPAHVLSPLAQADAQLVAQMEARLPPGTMVFELPVKVYPESGPVLAMEDYEHFRPYLHSRHLRFSYGTIRGRGDADWQQAVAQLPPPQLAEQVAQYGFGAVLVNRKAYADRAQALEAQLGARLGAPVAANADLVAFALPAASNPRLPPATPALRFDGFSVEERAGGRTWRWATQQEARIVVQAPFRPGNASQAARRLELEVESGNGGDVAVSLDGRGVEVAAARDGARRIRIELAPERNRWTVELRSTRPAQLPGNGDPRRIAFRVLDLRVLEAPPSS